MYSEVRGDDVLKILFDQLTRSGMPTIQLLVTVFTICICDGSAKCARPKVW